MTKVYPNALTFRTVLGIDTSSTAVPAIKVAAFNIGLIIAETISYSCVWDFVSFSSFAFAFCAGFSIDAGSTAVTPIKRTMAIVVVILAKTVPNQCPELTVYIWGVKQMFACTCKYFGGFFWKIFLPSVMHPEIVSGMGIATKSYFGTESSLSNNDMVQFLLEQVIE